MPTSTELVVSELKVPTLVSRLLIHCSLHTTQLPAGHVYIQGRFCYKEGIRIIYFMNLFVYAGVMDKISTSLILKRSLFHYKSFTCFVEQFLLSPQSRSYTCCETAKYRDCSFRAVTTRWGGICVYICAVEYLHITARNSFGIVSAITYLSASSQS